jgi:hypothetical protein
MEVLSDFPQEAGDAADILGVVGHGEVLSETISRLQSIFPEL